MNIRKHGISFEIATRAFDDAFALTEKDRVVETEQRWKTIALAPGTAVVVVIYTYPDEDVVRIISARKANRKELRLYAKQTHQ